MGSRLNETVAQTTPIQAEFLKQVYRLVNSEEGGEKKPKQQPSLKEIAKERRAKRGR